MGFSYSRYIFVKMCIRDRSESEGIRLVKKTCAWLMGQGKVWLIPGVIVKSGFKYLGYLLGKRDVYKRQGQYRYGGCGEAGGFRRDGCDLQERTFTDEERGRDFCSGVPQ